MVEKQAAEALLEQAGSEDELRERGGLLSRWIRPYRVELAGLVLLGLGIFLLVERFKIRVAVYNFLVRAVEWVIATAKWLWQAAVHIVYHTEQSDVVGIFLIIVAFMLLGHRWRVRAIARHVEIDSLEGCPRCGDVIRPIRRNFINRCMELLLWIKIQRHACTKCAFRHSTWQSRF